LYLHKNVSLFFLTVHFFSFGQKYFVQEQPFDVLCNMGFAFAVDQRDVQFLMDKLGGQLTAAQRDALEACLKQPFTVVTGPPGSGKTFTAVHLAGQFVQRNRMTPQSASLEAARTQVLICASTDAALDVIACK
jgi:superfamily II DNA or RNA helicase